MYDIKRTNTQIDDLLNDLAEADAEGTTKFRGMTYEQGAKYALEWLLGLSDDHPMNS
jgi:hypothetical protein